MSLYILAFPTIILFINLAGFSLNITTSKLISESLKSKKLSPKKIIKSSIQIAVKISLLIEIIFILSLKFITFKLLKTPDLYYPLLTILLLIPLVGITDTLRGVFAGYKKMRIVASVNIIEQISRIAFSILGVFLFSKYGIIISVTLTILALTIGELFSLIFLLFKIKKLNLIDYDNTLNEKKAIYKMALPTTGSKLIGCLTYFLEPIINTLTLLSLGYSKIQIDNDYTIINAYIIPLLTITSFLSTSLATVCLPSISENNALGKKDNINYLINKVFMFSLVPGIIISILLFIFPSEYMNLLFATKEGTSYIKMYVFIFLIHYLQAPGISIIQAIGKSSVVFKISTCFNLLRLVLIFVFANIKLINTYSVFYAITITMIFETLFLWLYIYINTNFKLDKNKTFSLLLISIIVYCLGFILQKISSFNFIIISIGLLLIYSILIVYNKIITISSLKKNS